MSANYVLLRKTTLIAEASSITFSNIPQTGYTDLKFVTSSRSTHGVLAVGGYVSFNGITTDFSTRYFLGTGSSVTSVTGGREFGSMTAGTATTGAFSNSEAIIPNYTSNTNKTYSVDTITESNGSEIYQYLFSGIWSNTSGAGGTTPAINSLTYSPASGNFVAGSTFYLYGIAAKNITPESFPLATGGNSVTNDGTYWYHTFLSSGVFSPNTNLSCDMLIVAGGGGGGSDAGGGGGGGGVVSPTSQSLTTTNYAVAVGAGGFTFSNGSNSQFGALTAAVGGGRGGGYATTALGGGSGGGASDSSGVGGTRGLGTAGQGNNGGNGGSSANGGGGGGAGSAGSNATSGPTKGGDGGVGTSSFNSWGAATLTGENVSGTRYYAGGGGGAGRVNPGNVANVGVGGSGGGGRGGSYTQVAGINGTANTGGGAGGSDFTTQASGGSGIVIIRYPIA
jgi:hypothetical protein